MRKIFITFILALGFCLNYGYSQLTISMSSTEVAPQEIATVNVSVSGFNSLTAVQFSINYDSTSLEFVSFSNYTTQLDGITSSVSSPIESSYKKGQVVVSWFDGNGASVPDGTVMFSMNFRAIGTPGTSSDIILSNVPIQIVVGDQNLNPIATNGIPGTVTITGDGGPVEPETCDSPDCANPSNLRFVAGSGSVQKDDQICVPITVRNFNNIIFGQGSISWDPAKLRYENIIIPTPNVLPGFSTSTLNTALVSQGLFGFIWDNSAPDIPITLSDNTTIMELCFTAIGNVGSTTCIEFTGEPPVSFEWGNENSNSIPICYTSGTINITDGTIDTDPVSINVGNVSGNDGDIVCVDVTVNNFKEVFSIETVFSWNPNQLRFVRTEGYNLEGLSSTVFANTESTLKISWINGGNPQTKPDGHTIFRICFELLCQNNNNFTAPVEIIGPTQISVSVNGSPLEVPSEKSDGSISVICGSADSPQCNIGSIVHPTCNGDKNGSIPVTVINGDFCEYRWKDGSGTVVKSGTVSDGSLNLTNVGGGTYTFEVVCSGSVVTTCTATVNEPLTITIPTSGVVSHIVCTGTGSINISGVSGGNGNYQYTWNPDLGNTPNLTGLTAGTYSLTVTDSKGCTAIQSFSVEEQEPPIIEISVTDITRPTPGADDGSITIVITGGSVPYSSQWSGGLSGGSTSGQQTITDVAAGTYSVTITDNNGCTAVRENIVVKDREDTNDDVAPEIGTVSVSSNYNGYGVLCFGDNSGQISGTIKEGTYPMTVTLKSGSQTIGNPKVINGPDFSFSNLVAGVYTVTITNDAGSIVSSNIEVTQPTKLNAKVSVKCSEDTNETGAIELNMGNSGAGNYFYQWEGYNVLGRRLENIPVGFYNVTIVDDNQCELKLTNIEVKECENQGDGGCYTASTIITPNGDNFNDYFVINCANDYPSDLAVFDRWGKQVYYKLNYDNTWQGVDSNGKDLREGGYIWVLTVNFGEGRKQVYKGTVTLLR